MKAPTTKERKFIKNMNSGNFDDPVEAAVAAGMQISTDKDIEVILSNPVIKPLIADTIEDQCKDLGISRRWKLSKLKHLIEAGIPDDWSHMDPELMTIALRAIDNINKLQGDYAPEKRINANFNIEANTQEAILTEKILQKLQKRYDRSF